MTEPVYLDAAVGEDLRALAAIEQDSFSHPFGAGHFENVLRSGRGRILVLRAPQPSPEEPNRGIRAYCVFETVLDEIHVHDLAVHPSFRRRGLGRQLLRLVLSIAVPGGAASTHLEVRRSNRAALELYRSLGFEIVGVRSDYYDQPREDALRLHLANQP